MTIDPGWDVLTAIKRTGEDPVVQVYALDSDEEERGVCMNCGADMDYNPMHPWCPECDREGEEDDNGEE